MSTIAGVDPGFNGAIAVLKKDDGTISYLKDMPIINNKKKELDEVEIRTIFEAYAPAYVFIEKARA